MLATRLNVPECVRVGRTQACTPQCSSSQLVVTRMWYPAPTKKQSETNMVVRFYWKVGQDATSMILTPALVFCFGPPTKNNSKQICVSDFIRKWDNRNATILNPALVCCFQASSPSWWLLRYGVQLPPKTIQNKSVSTHILQTVHTEHNQKQICFSDFIGKRVNRNASILDAAVVCCAKQH